jgi:hypothetical protein
VKEPEVALRILRLEYQLDPELLHRNQIQKKHGLVKMADKIGPQTAWYHDRGLRTLYLLLPVVILSSSYQGFDGMIMNGLQLLPSWQEGIMPQFPSSSTPRLT